MTTPKPFCRPLFHRMAAVACNINSGFPLPVPRHDAELAAKIPTTTTTAAAAAACSQHSNRDTIEDGSPWHQHNLRRAVHGNYTRAAESSVEATHGAPLASICNKPVRCEGEFGDGESERESERDHGMGGSWSAHRGQSEEQELKQACEKLCEWMPWKSEKRHKEEARSGFYREVAQCQAALHAFHEENAEKCRRSGERDLREEISDGYGCDGRLGQDRDTVLSLCQSQSEMTFARAFRREEFYENLGDDHRCARSVGHDRDSVLSLERSQEFFSVASLTRPYRHDFCENDGDLHRIGSCDPDGLSLGQSQGCFNDSASTRPFRQQDNHDKTGDHHCIRSCDHGTLNLGLSQSSFGDATIARPLRQDFGGKVGDHHCVRSCDGENLILGQSQSSFSDAAFGRPFRECCKERPMSAPCHQRMQRVTSSGRGSRGVDDRLKLSCSVSSRPDVRNGVTVEGVTKTGEDSVVVPLRPPSVLRNNERFRSKSADHKKPRFCTGLNRGKGETMCDEGAKRTLNVLPVIMLHRDKTKGVWNRKANQKEWDQGHRGCCSQHWVSVLENRDKVFRADGRISASARASISPIPKGKFNAKMAVQKLKVRGERPLPQVARSLDLSSSPLSSLKAIVNDMSRPQSASLPKRSNSVCTLRSASTCKSDQKPSSAVTPARKLKNPELNSSAWLLAKMEALRNETFTEPKALQIAKEHGLVLDKEDEAALKKFLQSEPSPRLDRTVDTAEREGNKTPEKYFNLSNIRVAESGVAVRKLKKLQLNPTIHAGRNCECCKNSTSDPSVASDHYSQVCLKPGDLNLTYLHKGPVFPDEADIWIERRNEACTTMTVNSSCQT